VHYPGTYAHGVYNREFPITGSHLVPNEDLVNPPRCWSMKPCLKDYEEPIRLATVDLLLSPRLRRALRGADARAPLLGPGRSRDELAQSGRPQYREDARRGAGADARGGQLAGTAHLREWRAIGRFEGPFRVYGNGMETNGQAEY